MSYFANISTFGPHHRELHGSSWSLPQLPHSDSFPHISSLLGLNHHDFHSEQDIPEDDPRYEHPVDLVPDKNGDVNHNCQSGSCRRITFNVNGHIFETQLGTLNRYPNTLLGNPFKRRELWDPEYRFYRLAKHAPTFMYILYYYQSGGRLYRPDDIPEDIFLKELEYYELGDQILKEFKRRNGFLPESEDELPENKRQRAVWMLFEHPASSLQARCIGIFSLLIIILSIVNFCLESIPSFESNLCINDTDSIRTDEFGVVNFNEKQNYKSPFFILECICAAWFTIEVLVRFATCPSKKRFFVNLLNIFDILAVVPFYVITVVIVLSGSCDHSKRSSISIVFLRVLRLFRSFRIFKLTKHSRGMQILGLTIRQSLQELTLFALFLGIAVIFFSAAIYYADMFDTASENIASIPEGFWWTIITMTTVGYGDVVPTGVAGKLVGSLCVISGVITIALLVPVVVSNFSQYYSHETQARGQSKESPSSGEGNSGCTQS